MRLSVRLFNFAVITAVLLITCMVAGCKGRTMENMTPTGDTVEVVIMQTDTIVNQTTNQ